MLVIALAAVASLPAKAQLVVGTCVAGTQYSTIQTAVNAAPSGSTIKVCPGGYQEQVVIEKPLTLAGIISGGAEGAWVLPPTGGWAATDPTSTYTPQILVKNAKGVTISNLIVDAANNNAQCGMYLTGILFHNASGTVNKAAVRNQLTINSAIQCVGYGVVATVDNQQAQTVLVENTDFRNNGYQALTAWGPGLTMNSVGNFVTGGDNSQIGGIGIAYLAGATGTVQGNTVTNEIDIYGGAGPALSNATGIAVDCASATVTGNVVTNTQLGIYVGHAEQDSLYEDCRWDLRVVVGKLNHQEHDCGRGVFGHPSRYNCWRDRQHSVGQYDYRGVHRNLDHGNGGEHALREHLQ
jgi:hypothetical protein